MKDIEVCHIYSQHLILCGSVSDEFPKEMQSSVTKKPKGKFYQDFYKVITNSEHIDDWNLVAVKLKTNFNNYLNWVGCDSEKLRNQPLGKNSRSLDGNVLEAINVSLNGKYSTINLLFTKLG